MRQSIPHSITRTNDNRLSPNAPQPSLRKRPLPMQQSVKADWFRLCESADLAKTRAGHAPLAEIAPLQPKNTDEPFPQ